LIGNVVGRITHIVDGVVGSSSVQPTLPNGVLGSQSIGLTRQLSANDQSQIRQNFSNSFNVQLDPVREITGVTDDQGNVTVVAYDLFGHRTAINSPDAGLTTFTYDLADNLTAKQTANLQTAGQEVTFAYQFNR
jgi:YD repeat-containing protein